MRYEDIVRLAQDREHGESRQPTFFTKTAPGDDDDDDDDTITNTVLHDNASSFPCVVSRHCTPVGNSPGRVCWQWRRPVGCHCTSMNNSRGRYWPDFFLSIYNTKHCMAMYSIIRPMTSMI